MTTNTMPLAGAQGDVMFRLRDCHNAAIEIKNTYNLSSDAFVAIVMTLNKWRHKFEAARQQDRRTIDNLYASITDLSATGVNLLDDLNAAKQRIATLEGERNDYHATVVEQEREMVAKEKRIAELEAQLQEAIEDAAHWRNTVQWNGGN